MKILNYQVFYQFSINKKFCNNEYVDFRNHSENKKCKLKNGSNNQSLNFINFISEIIITSIQLKAASLKIPTFLVIKFSFS